MAVNKTAKIILRFTLMLVPTSWMPGILHAFICIRCPEPMKRQLLTLPPCLVFLLLGACEQRTSSRDESESGEEALEVKMVNEYTQAEDHKLARKRLGEGTFALQAHDPGSVVVRSFKVRRLS